MSNDSSLHATKRHNRKREGVMQLQASEVRIGDILHCNDGVNRPITRADRIDAGYDTSEHIDLVCGDHLEELTPSAAVTVQRHAHTAPPSLKELSKSVLDAAYKYGAEYDATPRTDVNLVQLCAASVEYSEAYKRSGARR